MGKTYPDDDPALDCTDGAHPAWWRGSDAGVRGACESIKKVLDTGEVSGVTASPELQGIRERVKRLMEGSVTKLEECLRRVRMEKGWDVELECHGVWIIRVRDRETREVLGETGATSLAVLPWLLEKSLSDPVWGHSLLETPRDCRAPGGGISGAEEQGTDEEGGVN